MVIQFTTCKHIYHDDYVQNIFFMTDMVFFALTLLSDIRNVFPETWVKLSRDQQQDPA